MVEANPRSLRNERLRKRSLRHLNDQLRTPLLESIPRVPQFEQLLLFLKRRHIHQGDFSDALNGNWTIY